MCHCSACIIYSISRVTVLSWELKKSDRFLGLCFGRCWSFILGDSMKTILKLGSQRDGGAVTLQMFCLKLPQGAAREVKKLREHWAVTRATAASHGKAARKIHVHRKVWNWHQREGNIPITLHSLSNEISGDLLFFSYVTWALLPLYRFPVSCLYPCDCTQSSLFRASVFL